MLASGTVLVCEMGVECLMWSVGWWLVVYCCGSWLHYLLAQVVFV